MRQAAGSTRLESCEASQNIQPGAGVSGSGLPIVKQIIEKHGGSCTVTSSEAEGTCFTISLPPEA